MRQGRPQIGMEQLSSRQLLDLHCDVMDELRRRGIVRSSNNPVADYTEALFARAMNASLSTNSQAGFDALGADGTRYQIKGRRLTAGNRRMQLSAIRNLDGSPFDQLAAVIYDHRLCVQHAALIPIEVVRRVSKYSEYTNSHALHYRRQLLEEAGVVDITAQLKIAELA